MPFGLAFTARPINCLPMHLYDAATTGYVVLQCRKLMNLHLQAAGGLGCEAELRVCGCCISSTVVSSHREDVPFRSVILAVRPNRCSDRQTLPIDRQWHLDKPINRCTESIN